MGNIKKYKLSEIGEIKDASSLKSVEKGGILIPTGAAIKRLPKYFKEKTNIKNESALLLIVNKEFNSFYIYLAIISCWKQFVCRVIQNMNIPKAEIENMTIYINTDRTKQDELVGKYKIIERLIDLEEDTINNLKEFKKTCLNDMFM